MRDVYEVLRQKENDLERVRKEVEALRRVARLLDDETRQPDHSPEMPRSSLKNNRWPLRVEEPPTYLNS